MNRIIIFQPGAAAPISSKSTTGRKPETQLKMRLALSPHVVSPFSLAALIRLSFCKLIDFFE